MNYTLWAFLALLEDYRYLYHVTDSQRSRGRYLYWIASTVIAHDRLTR